MTIKPVQREENPGRMGQNHKLCEAITVLVEFCHGVHTFRLFQNIYICNIFKYITCYYINITDNITNIINVINITMCDDDY